MKAFMVLALVCFAGCGGENTAGTCKTTDGGEVECDCGDQFVPGDWSCELGFRASITAMCINQDVMTTAYEIETRTCPNMRKCTECENLGKTFFECLEAVKADDPESCYRCWGGAPWNEFKLCLENQCGWI